MSRRLRNRAEMLTAFVAAIAILVGPVVAFGTCCCSTAAAAQQTDATVCEHTAGGLIARSCEAAVPATASSCCAAKAPKLTDSRPCCQPPSAGAPDASSPLGKTPCKCTESCCDAALSDSTAILIEPVLQRDVTGDWVALTTVLEPAPRDLFAAPGNVLRQPAFLSAQAHCAMFCRWLN